MRTSAGGQFEFLSDADGRLLDLFGLRHEKGRYDGVDIAQSASFLIDATGHLVWQRVADNYRVRPHPKEILAAADEKL